MTKQKIISIFLILCIILCFSACGNIAGFVDAVVTTKDGEVINCNGYEYKKLFNKYDNDKDNPYYRATLTVTDEVKEIEELNDTFNSKRVYLKSGWNFVTEDIGDLQEGTSVYIEGYVVYQNFSNQSSTAIYVENYTINN